MLILQLTSELFMAVEVSYISVTARFDSDQLLYTLIGVCAEQQTSTYGASYELFFSVSISVDPY